MSGLIGPSPLARGSPSPPSTLNGVPSVPPSNSQIEAVIQMATSVAASDSRTSGRDTRTQLFVGNLPYRVRWQDLKDLFRKAGTVLRADVSLGPDNRSRGYGTVLLATSEDAARAVDMFNGYNWQTRTLEVRPDRLPPDLEFSNPMMTTNPPVSLPLAASGHTLPLPIHPAPVPYGASLGNGSSPASGSEDEITTKLIGERVRTASTGSRSLFVGNLPFHCQWQDLKDLFRQAGTIVRADVALGPDGRSRGFGTVSFSTDADAERALNTFNGYDYNGRTLKVHYDKFFQCQPSQSPIPTASLPVTNSQLSYTHSNAPSHISLPRPPPPSAFEQLIPGHQSPSSFEQHPFGQISPYDIYPPHIAAIAGNAAAQAYMNNPRLSPPVAAPDPSMAWTPLLSPTDSSQSSLNKRPTAEKADPPVATPSRSPSSTHHPGPIALPSPPLHPFTHVSGPSSPLQGLPPITPSMPTFTFVPQNATPPLNAHFLSPGIGLSPFSPPGTMSPGSFYHPASNQRHPIGHVWNVAPGAPVQMHSPVGSPGSPGYYAVHPHHPPSTSEGHGGSPHANVGLGMSDYFSVPPAPRVSEGYFPPVSTLRNSGLSNEIIQNRTTSCLCGSDAAPSNDSSAPTTDVSSEPSGRGSGEGNSSETSWEETLAEENVAVAKTTECLGNVSLGYSPETQPDGAGDTPIQRTNSDGVETIKPLRLALPSGDMAPWGSRRSINGKPGERGKDGESSGTTSERRASWTPEGTRVDFRRGLIERRADDS